MRIILKLSPVCVHVIYLYVDKVLICNTANANNVVITLVLPQLIESGEVTYICRKHA